MWFFTCTGKEMAQIWKHYFFSLIHCVFPCFLRIVVLDQSQCWSAIFSFPEHLASEFLIKTEARRSKHFWHTIYLHSFLYLFLLTFLSYHLKMKCVILIQMDSYLLPGIYTLSLSSLSLQYLAVLCTSLFHIFLLSYFTTAPNFLVLIK